jgi:hypothetical protein
MVSPLFFSQLVLVALVWLCVILHGVWPSGPVAACSTTLEPHPHGVSAATSRNPLWASPRSRTATPVPIRIPTTPTPLQPHPRVSS